MEGFALAAAVPVAVLYSHPAWTVADRVKLLIDILQGLGLSQAAGIRPFLPALVAGAAARANFLIDLEGTDFAFMERPWWFGALAVAAILALFFRRVIERSAVLNAALAGLCLGMGALLFSALLSDDGYAWWPGIPAGIAGAWLSGTAARDIMGRAGARLDDHARGHLPVFAEGVAILLAALSIVAPPVALVSAGFFAWRILLARRRETGKHAGLRILR
ncbi:unannotated protein [freshwater metagenome]|uniref:Unannotated protein n=1 Tax=freshwater metagenome TaxID=449393 RepID=A0A6J7CMG5_9ZZZZ|nr:DUF4126 family protein [Actinomycetota bacterium]